MSGKLHEEIYFLAGEKYLHLVNALPTIVIWVLFRELALGYGKNSK